MANILNNNYDIHNKFLFQQNPKNLNYYDKNGQKCTLSLNSDDSEDIPLPYSEVLSDEPLDGIDSFTNIEELIKTYTELILNETTQSISILMSKTDVNKYEIFKLAMKKANLYIVFNLLKECYDLQKKYYKNIPPKKAQHIYNKYFKNNRSLSEILDDEVFINILQIIIVL